MAITANPLGFCWSCLTGVCLQDGIHKSHKPVGVGDGGMIEAVTMNSGTPLCKDCARWRSNSQI